MTGLTSSHAIVDQLEALYAQATRALRDALRLYLETGARPNPEARKSGAFAYPELVITYAADGPSPRLSRAYALIRKPGVYRSTLTRPALFRPYLVEQLDLLIQDYGVEIEVRPSTQEIPYPYVLDGAQGLDLDRAASADLAKWFPTTQLVAIGDETADGLLELGVDGDAPLALFDALRVDFSLARLKHYTGGPAEHVQPYVLFTNYHRYMDEFVTLALAEIRKGGRYTHLSCPGGVMVDAKTPDAETKIAEAPWRRHQMPAYHLIAEDGRGISLVNIGVGPSNAKTITDHLAVLRPEAWLMIGHCGGLRPSQTIGDYVLAHAYLRDDHVLDAALPPEIPIPAIAEVQLALFQAAERITGEAGEVLKRRLRTGTVVTTDDRNWELRYTASALRFNQSRAVAIDMESATIAAQGYRFRVPYGTLLCVSDKPLHGELKLPGQANRFYEQAISQHLRIGIKTMTLLHREGSALHSRKLRAFDEPPFR